MRRLPRSVFGFIEGGSEARTTVRANEDAFEQILFRPRVAADRRPRELRTTVLGREIAMPVITAPAGLIRIAHPDGEAAVARAAEAAGIPVAVSILASRPIEEITGLASDVWFQLYMIGGRDGAEIAIDRARRAGCRVLVVTVDKAASTGGDDESYARSEVPGRIDLATAVRYAPEMVRRPRWAYHFVRGGLRLEVPNAPTAGPGEVMTVAEGGTALREHPPTWDDIAWIREQWSGPLVVKGIMAPDDARRAADLGVDAVSVSNHGGNALDGAQATVVALPEVVEAVGDRIEVLMDGGVRRGGDVVRALGLGARAVLIGRGYVWPLAAAGEDGVRQALELYRRGIDATLALLACPSVRDVDGRHLVL
jgi:isopentenyl diphosphate isomerase/L-lactate dehydrogenase-like FMN-dependent dehydrogenase